MRRFRALVAAVRSERRLAEMAGSIVSSQVLTGALGVVFWGLAARSFAHESVGGAGAASASALLVATFALLGQGSLVVSELSATEAAQRRELVVSAVLLVTAASVLVGAGLFAAAGVLSTGTYHAFAVNHLGFLVAVGACVLVAQASLFDQTMLVIDKPRMQVIRNGLASVLRIAALLLSLGIGPASARTGSAGSAVLLACWALGWLPSNVLAVRSISRSLGRHGRRSLPRLAAHGRIHGRGSLAHYGISVSLASGFLLQPVVIGLVLSAQTNARFTAVRLASGLVLLVPYAIATAVFTASAGDSVDLRTRSQRALRVSLSLSAGLLVLVVVLADPVVRLLGGNFAGPAANALRLMCAAGPLLVFKDQYIAVARTQRVLGPALRLAAAGAVAEVSLITLGAHLGGLDGALVGWLAALAVQAVVSALRLRSGTYFESPTSAA